MVTAAGGIRTGLPSQLDTPLLDEDAKSEASETASVRSGVSLAVPKMRKTFIDEAGDVEAAQSASIPSKFSCLQPFKFKWKARVVLGACVVGAVALRVIDTCRVVNALSGVAIGGFSMWSVGVGFTGVGLAQIQRVALMTFNMTTFYGVNSLFFIASAQNWMEMKVVLANITNVILGANAQMFIHRRLDEGLVQMTSHDYSKMEGERLPKPWISPTLANVMKLGVAFTLAGLIWAQEKGTYILNDPAAHGLASFLAPFFGFEIVGWAAFLVINDLIKSAVLPHEETNYKRCLAWLKGKQIEKNVSESRNKGSRWIVVQELVNSLAPLAIMSIDLPWESDAADVDHKTWLICMGAVMGFFDQIPFEALNKRLKKTPISELHEMDALPPPGEEQKRKICCCQLSPYSIWNWGYQLLALGGIGAYVVYEMRFDSSVDTTVKKMGIGSMTIGFLASYILSYTADKLWKKRREFSVRARTLVDKLATTLFLEKRILGIRPLYLFLAIMRAMSISSANVTNNSELRNGLFYLGWGCYGWEMASALIDAVGLRRGALSVFPSMVLILSAQTFWLSLTGNRNGVVPA